MTLTTCMKVNLIIALALVVINVGSSLFTYSKGITLGKTLSTATCTSEKAGATETKVQTKVKQDEIRDNRPDVDRVAGRLLKHTF